MITLYSGTPGSGKSLHVARNIYTRLKLNKMPVIATFPINTDYVSEKGKHKIGEFYYRDITEMTTEYLINYALEHHRLGEENQTLVVIDECQIIYNPREFGRGDRLKWIVFFTQHRKLGFNFILISQFDRQIRCLLEYNVVHRKCNNMGLLWLLPIKFFISINMWYGTRDKCGHEFFVYRKKFGRMYDSFMMFDDNFKKYIKENGDKISEFNRKKLGLEKLIESEAISESEHLEDSEIVSKVIEQYVDIFSQLPDGQGKREVIESEVTTALEAEEPPKTLHKQL